MDPSKLKAQRKHHFVWAWHLSRWSSNGRDVHYMTPKGKVGQDSVKGLAREDYFYRAQPLTPRQVELVRRTITAAAPGENRNFLSEMLERWLNIQRAVGIARSRPEIARESHQACEALECNFIETFHAAHELRAKAAMEALMGDDPAALSDRSILLSICMYAGQATMRTRSLRDRVAQARALTMSKSDDADLTATWWFLSVIYGANLGQSLYHGLGDCNVSLLKTGDDMPFIFSDHPVVNIHSAPDRSLDLVMPISPNRAISISESKQFEKGVVSIASDDVDRINLTQAGRASMIFGSSVESVQRYLAYVNLI